MSAGERDRAAQTRLLGAAVEINDAAVLGRLVGILFEILCNSIADSAAGGVIHSTAGCVARIGISPHDKERAADSCDEGQEAHSEHEVHERGRSESFRCPACAEIIAGVEGRDGNRSACEEEEAESAEADLDEGGNEAECGVCLSELRSVLGMTPVPAGVGMAGEDDGVVILAVLREQLAIGVLRYFLLEEHIEPGLIKENAADEPDDACRRSESHAVPDCGDAHCDIDKGAQRETEPACIGDSADVRTRGNRKLFANGLDADLSELIAHIGSKLFFAVRTRQSRADVLRGMIDYVVYLFGILSVFFFHEKAILLLKMCHNYTIIRRKIAIEFKENIKISLNLCERVNFFGVGRKR